MRNHAFFKKAVFAVFLFAALVVLLSSRSVIPTVNGNSFGPPPGRTGAPGELTCTTSGCHGGGLNEGLGKLTIVAPEVYEPGKTYQIAVVHTTPDSSRRRWGFEFTALSADNKAAGRIESGNALTSVTDNAGPDGTRQYINHNTFGTFPGQADGAMWSFSWTAPASNAGPITFYAAGNQANNDGTNNGDQIYATQVTVGAASAGTPTISSAEVAGKQLIVHGDNFAIGASLFMDDNREKKVFNDDLSPGTILIGRKSGKKIAPGSTVHLQVVNPDGAASASFEFMRPM